MTKRAILLVGSVGAIFLSVGYIAYTLRTAGQENLTPNRGPNREVQVICADCGYRATVKHQELVAQAAASANYWSPVEMPKTTYQTIPCPKDKRHRAWVVEAGQAEPTSRPSSYPSAGG